MTFACDRAIKAGVRAGIPLSQARALLPAGRVRIEPADERRDRAALRAIAVWADRFSPCVSVHEPDTLIADVSGCASVFHGEDKLIHQLWTSLSRLGFSSRCAIAPTIGCAWAAARHLPGPTTIIEPGRERETLAPMPVSVLRLEADAVAALAEVGITCVGELLKLPRSALPSRFGDELLIRLDHALGQAMETITPVRILPALTQQHTLDGPTTRIDSIMALVTHLLDGLIAQLRHRDRGVRRLDITLDRTDLPPAMLTLTLSRATRDEQHLWRLIRPRLERIHMGFGVERVELKAAWLGPVTAEQASCWIDRHDQADEEARLAADELVDAFVNRLGPSRVLRAGVVQSHIPERASAMTSLAGRSIWEREKGDRAAGSFVAESTGAGSSPPRPGITLDPPESARVIAMTPDGPVATIRWRDEDLHARTCLGPERIALAWWTGGNAPRDFFQVQDQHGRWLWLARSLLSNQWSICGVW